MFRKLDLFPSSGRGERETPTLLGPLERANLTHCAVETLCFPVFRIPDNEQSPQTQWFCVLYTIVRNLQVLIGLLRVSLRVELSLSLRPTVSRPVRLDIGLPFGAHDQILSFPFSSDNCFVVLPVGRPLWREDEAVTYSAIADWSGHWGPITIHYRLIWDCVPSWSPLTTRRDCSGGILTRLHTG
jgi:hypothetical protein